MSEEGTPPCLGVLGWMFGHQFLKSKRGWTYESNSCFRCGWTRS